MTLSREPTEKAGQGETAGEAAPAPKTPPAKPKPGARAAVTETGGPRGPEPTRYGDWERKGRCIDF